LNDAIACFLFYILCKYVMPYFLFFLFFEHRICELTDDYDDIKSLTGSGLIGDQSSFFYEYDASNQQV